MEAKPETRITSLNIEIHISERNAAQFVLTKIYLKVRLMIPATGLIHFNNNTQGRS